MKLKVVTVVGTRPEIIRLSRVIAELDKYCDHTLVHTGQNHDYELNQVFFDDLGVRLPDVFLDCTANSKSAVESIANILSKTEAVLEEVRPDAFVVLGDTNSCLSALVAKKRKIPIFHMEAGNRCFDARVPEETNRKIVDHLADINLPYSDIAREYLLREGILPDRIIKTGSPMMEVITGALPKMKESRILQKLDLEPGKYFVVSAHREENIEPEHMFENLVTILNALATTYGLPVIVSTHPRLRKRIKESGQSLDSRINLLRPLGYFDYLKLQTSSHVVLSDSGTISEESSILNFPALNLRETHERPEAMEETSVPMVGLNLHAVLRGISLVEKQGRDSDRRFFTPRDYEYTNVSAKVVRIIHSYVDYVNRNVWKAPIELL